MLLLTLSIEFPQRRREIYFDNSPSLPPVFWRSEKQLEWIFFQGKKGRIVSQKWSIDWGLMESLRGSLAETDYSSIVWVYRWLYFIVVPIGHTCPSLFGLICSKPQSLEGATLWNMHPCCRVTASHQRWPYPKGEPTHNSGWANLSYLLEIWNWDFV